MDSWTLQGDSYSFLRSAPRNFSLCHRDGTPNHVEIFDIISVPSQRSAISETTCLCDIFGDDCESPSFSSSPAAGHFTLSQREVDGTAAASPLADDLNESSGSYHSAQSFSEGEEGFEDSCGRLYSPQLQSEFLQKRQLEGERQSSGHPEDREDTKTNLELKSKSPAPQLRAASPSFYTVEKTASLGHNSPDTLIPVGSVSSLSSSSVDKACSPTPPHPEQEAKPRRVTPTLQDSHNSPSHQSLTPSPSLEPRNCVSSSCSQSLNTQSLAESRIAQVSPEPRSSYCYQNSSPSPDPTPKDFSPDFTESACDSQDSISSPLPSPSNIEESYQSRETPVSPELKNSSYSPHTEASSPFPELRRRISLPDLFSRGSTPDIQEPTYNPEQISDFTTAGKDTTTTPDSQGARHSAEPVSAASTPAPRYTPPSPVISFAPSPELVESSAFPELSHTVPSPCLLSAASSDRTGSRTPSPGISHKTRHISTPSEIGTPASSPAVSHSLSPSPGVISNCSSIEHKYTSPSPEIRITASSPEGSRREGPSEERATSSSPLLEPTSARSLTSSPHITGISYSVVQPEDRISPAFPELSHLSTPEPDRIPLSPETRSPTPSRDSLTESSDTPQDFPHILGTGSVIEPEITFQPRYQPSSPQPQHHTPSPEPRSQTPSSDKYQSPSPQHRSKVSSPVAPPSKQHYHQISPANVPTEYNPEYCPLRNTPEFEVESSSIDITETQCQTHLAKESASPSFELDSEGTSTVTKIKSRSPVAVASPVSTSPFLAEEKGRSSPKPEKTERETRPQEVKLQDSSCIADYSEEKHTISATLIEEQDIYNNFPTEIESTSPYLVSENKSPSLSIQRAPSNSPVVRVGNSQPQVTSYSPTFEDNNSLITPCILENTRTQLSTQVRRENSERLAKDMAHFINRRRTPSPPLTRFTPVHIIAPEKPYRHWQNSSRSTSQVGASSASGNLKKALTNRESPNVAPVDNNSQAHWVRLGMQLEMDREMQLETDREAGRERLMDREMERKKVREEQLPEKGKGWQGEGSYRGEQVELSFNARNRKGPVSHRTARTSRETSQGLPAAHSYSESLLATRQLQQQQSLLRLASQQETRIGGSGRRRQPSAPQNKDSAGGRVAINRPCQSSSSSMGSELDEADNEVKWFTDLAFHSLSSPEVDYLDMYNSSHRSSTNISQPSTQESPAGVNAAWLAYADLRGSAPKLDNDEHSIQQPPANYSDGLDPSRRFELGSFECIDVAMERDDSRKARRGVPKRQIQLKKKDNGEVKQDQNSQNSSPNGVMMMESPPVENLSRETLVRQHSTPATIPECFPAEHNPDANQQNERNFKLEKSVSLDETCSKNRMATCLIQSVLSKKMQHVDKQLDDLADVSPSLEAKSPQTEAAVEPQSESPKADEHNLSSSLQSDYSLSSEGLCMSGEPHTKDEAKLPRGFGGRFSHRPSSSSSSRSVNFSQTESEEADSQSRHPNSLRSQRRSELKVPFESKQSGTGVHQVDDGKIWDEEGGDSANTTAGNTEAPSDTGISSMQCRVTNSNHEFENTEDHKQLRQGDKDTKTSKIEEISLKAMEKKKASLNVCLTPEAENKPEGSSPDVRYRGREVQAETIIDEKTEDEEEEKEGNKNNQVKVPIHKVRDVRRLVKNTYNLTFNAPSASVSSNVNEEMTKNFNEVRREEIKEERVEEVIEEEETEVRQEIRREDRREDNKEEFRMDIKEEDREDKDSKLRIFAPPLQTKGNALSRPQPMQIEYKAVCWKEDKNKMPCIMKDNLCGKSQTSPKHVIELNKEPQKSNTDKQSETENYTTDTANPRSYQHDLKITAGAQESKTEMHTFSDNEDKPIMVKTDRKPPILGSLPKMPSKEREVSTAVVLIRDGSSKTRISASATQEQIPTPPQVPGASHSPGATAPGSSGHSVSMLLKEKGYQADIGAVVGDNQNVGGKRVSCKHVNSLEIPLQTSSNMSGPSVVSDNTETLAKTSKDEGASSKSNLRDTAQQKDTSLLEQTPRPTRQTKLGDFEAVKRQDPTFPLRSPVTRRFRPQPIEVKSVSKEIQKQEMLPNYTANKKPQTIEVKSIAKNSQKPVVPPKPSCKFKPADLGAMSYEAQRPAATVKQQGEDRPQTIVVSSPTIYRKISNESSSASNYTRKLSVSAVSSLKAPPCKTTEVTTSLSNQSIVPSETEATQDRGQQQRPVVSSQSSVNTKRPTTLAIAPTSAIDPSLSSAPGPVSDSDANQVAGPASARATQSNQPQYPRMPYPQEQVMPGSLNAAKQPAASTSRTVAGYTRQPYHRSFSGEHSQRTDDLCFYASDDPPSYDERESFSPLMLPDLTPRRSNSYQPSSRPPPCSCTAGCPSHPGLTPPQHHRSPHSLTPPAPSHSPGQALSYPLAQPPLRPHQCRADPQQMSYQPGSPKPSPVGPGQPPAMYQSIHQPPPCPPHHSLMQACPADRPLQPPQHIDSRRPAIHRSPQQQPPGMAGATYCDPGHSHSPGLPPMDPQYLCGPQSLGPSYGSEYGGDSSSLYSENNYGQAPRRVLLDPETGKYFYIEVPVQPLRKMLFDPETGQYVEVLIPQQAMSHSSLYPPSAAPYPPLHNPNMYAPASQYLPYAAPQAQPQPPRYPEASAAATSGPGVSYRNTSGQAPKPEPQNHPPLDQSYLESMYYVPTGMTASPNPTPPDYYHKHPPNLPPTGGKRS